MIEIVFFAIALLATAAGVAVFLRYGRGLATLDVPNDRSSHHAPTPRGGGVVIVAVCLLLYLAAAPAGMEPANWSFVVGAIMVAAVSWADDHVDLPAWIRLSVHALAAAVLIAGSGPVEGILVPGYGMLAINTVLSYGLTFLWVVWLINAYNFMDGIDGLAGSQAVVAGVGWAVAAVWFNDEAIYLLAGVVTFSSLGFLIHNWNPARVFMGDVGSAFLGYTFAAMPLLVRPSGPENRYGAFAIAITLLWLFLFDTFFTFVRRLLKRERVWLAHRKHLYQRLVIAGLGHARVSLLYAVLAAAVGTAYFVSARFGGIVVPLLFLCYLAAPAVVLFLAWPRKGLT
ncbi:MAG: glycosyltransferase family 4 protein [Pyrinomonadaceae bacterium]